MSLDKSRIPKRGNSSRKFIPEKQRKTMTDPFVDWINRSRSDKRGTVSGRMLETRSQKTSEERRELLEVEVNTDHAMNDNQEVNGLEGRGRRLASESTPVEQGHDFATSTGTLDREEMSELSDISTEVAATRRSPTDNTMMASGTGKQTTSSSFSERMKNTLGNIFPFSMGGGAGNDGESQEDEEDEEEQGDFGSQVSLNSSIQESEAHVGRETGTMDKFGVVTTISKEANTPGQSKDFAIRTSSEPQSEESRTRGLGNALMDPELNYEKTLKQRVKARISTSTKLPGTDRVTPPLVTPLMDNGAALEEALNNIVGSLGEQNEQMSIRMSELERAVHIERESLREEINRNRQEVGRSEKRLKERTDEHMTRNLSRMTREAEQRELRLRANMEKLRIQQEQSLGSLDTTIDAMMERRTQAIMDRLDGLLSSKSGPKEGEPNSGGPSREPRVNFNEHQRRKTYGSTRGRGSSSGYATRGNTAWGPNSRASSTGNRQTSNERPTQSTHATGRSDSGNMGHTSPRRSHMGQAGNAHGDSDCRDAPHTEPSTRCEDTQAGHSRDATAMATAFEPLNRSLETFLTRLSRTNERSEKSRRVFKKPRCYKDESDGCIDTWIEVMKLHFEEEDLSERQECSALTSNLEGTALNCVMAKKQYQRDTAEKIFEILLNRFGSGVQGHQAMMRFEKRRQREDETIDKFLDDLEMLRRRSQPDESNRRMNLAVASKFIDGVKNDELRTMLATHYTPLSTNAPTPEELRLKSKEYLLLKPPSRSGYYKNNYGNFNNGPANQGNNWYKPRDDMDKRRSCANCSSTDHHVSACPAYKQGMKAIGFSLEDEAASELDHEDFMRGVIAKFGPRCFFCNLEGHFKSDCPQFWDAVADIKHPRHEEALTGVTKKYGNLLMCYVDDVVIATPTLEDHIDRLDEVFGCMKRAGLKCKPSECEILRDSIKYLGRMVDRHGVRPDPEAVEAVLTWKAPRTDTQLMSFLGFANYYREFIKGYADKVYPMQKLMRNKGKKFEWNDEAQVAFENIKRELCEAPVLGMPTEKGMYVLDTDASVVAISGILHQEQEWNGRTVLHPIAYGSKVLSDTEMKYGAPKAEMFAVVTFVEKYRAYLGSAPFKLRVDNRALSWLKTYSMDQSYIGRWIVRLDGYHMIIEHRMRDKHQNADSLSKKTEFYERLEQKQANQAEVKEGFSFLDKETYEALPLTRWLDKSGHPIPGHPELPVEKAA